MKTRIVSSVFLIVCGNACTEVNSAPAKQVAPAAVVAAKGAAIGTAEGAVCKGGEGCCAPLDPNAVPNGAAALAVAGTKYGAGVTVAEVVPVSKILANPDEYAGKRVRVEGKVADVCQMRGCWFEMESDKPAETIKFKVTDGVMTFPTTAKGKYAVAEGIVKKMPLTLEQTIKMKEHEALEQGKPFDPASVKEPTTMIRLDGVGAVIRDQK